MSSLAEYLPIELVNHILSFRPRHPVACLIKKLKERTIVLYMANNPIMRKSLAPFDMTFKELDENSKHSIFSICIRPNSIYKIKTKKYKNSEEFYWGKYYTQKKAYEELEEAKKSFYYCGDIYSIELVNIDNDSLDEHTVYYQYNGDSDTESEEDNTESEEDISIDGGCVCGCRCECGRRDYYNNYESEEEED